MNRTMNFLEEDAKLYGVKEAIILYNIRFWILTNKANKDQRHFYDGRYWVYYTHEALVELFPFFTISQIKTAINNLIDKKALQKEQLNKKNLDNTNWYSLIEEDSNFEPKLLKSSISQKSPVDQLKIADAPAENRRYHTDIKLSNKKQREKESDQVDSMPNEIIKAWNKHDSLPSIDNTIKLQTMIGRLLIKLENDCIYPRDIINAIDNFAKVKASPRTWFKGRYTLPSFLGVNGRKSILDRFYNDLFDHQEYINESNEVSIDEIVSEDELNNKEHEDAQYLNSLFGEK